MPLCVDVNAKIPTADITLYNIKLAKIIGHRGLVKKLAKVPFSLCAVTSAQSAQIQQWLLEWDTAAPKNDPFFENTNLPSFRMDIYFSKACMHLCSDWCSSFMSHSTFPVVQLDPDPIILCLRQTSYNQNSITISLAIQREEWTEQIQSKNSFNLFSIFCLRKTNSQGSCAFEELKWKKYYKEKLHGREERDKKKNQFKIQSDFCVLFSFSHLQTMSLGPYWLFSRL